MTAVYSYKVNVTKIRAFHWGEQENSFVVALWKKVDLFWLYKWAKNLNICNYVHKFPSLNMWSALFLLYCNPSSASVNCWKINSGCCLSASVSVKSVTAEKKPITSSDTAWQYCLNGCRHMPDSSGQLAEDLSISVHITVHVSIPLLLCNE